MGYDLTEDEEKAIRRVAREVTRQFSQYVDFEDVSQEAHLWVYSNYSTVESWRTSTRKPLYPVLYRKITGWALGEKAQTLGVEVADMYRYKTGEIEALVKEYLGAGNAMDLVGKVNSDPATRGNWLASRMDIQNAWNDLSPTQQVLLTEYVDPKLTEDQLAQSYDISKSALRKRKERALQRMRAYLNGEQ